jgi:hypothetical protein
MSANEHASTVTADGDCIKIVATSAGLSFVQRLVILIGGRVELVAEMPPRNIAGSHPATMRVFLP